MQSERFANVQIIRFIQTSCSLYCTKRLSDYFSQPSNDVVGSIDYGFISRIPSGIHSKDAAKVSAFQQSTKSMQKNKINFSSLMGEWHWKQTYKRVYKQQQGMWLTPCELFTPHYSNILANFISKSMNVSLRHNDHVTFDIVELGGGRGTNANVLLDYMRDTDIDMYERLDSYTIFDTSPTLHELQREVLISGSNGEGRIHADKIKLVNTDLMDIADGRSPFLSQSNKPTVLIALELLDNLPHDKIAQCMHSNEILQAEVLQASDVDTLGTARKHYQSEIFYPLDDKLLQDILSIAPEIYTPKSSQGPRWVPSVALGVLIKLYACRPNSSIAIADFDWLPPPDLSDPLSPPLAEPAIGDPLVTDMNGQDHSCYLSSPSDALCDILFPTDFVRLVAFVKQIHPSRTSSDPKVSTYISSMKQKEFLLKHGLHEIEQTKSWITGYSPLIDDFGNCSVLEVIHQ